MNDVTQLPLSEKTRLVVDAGGSTLRLVECDLDGKRLAHEKYLQPQDIFASMDEGIERFLRELGHRPAVAVIGAAGPIEDGVRVKLTNNSKWPVFDTQVAETNFGIKFNLLNDLVIAAASLAVLGPDDLHVLREGVADGDGPKLVATLSTGLNDAVATTAHDGHLTYIAGESGHTPFAPRDETEAELLSWAWKRGKRYVSFEDVISGRHGFRLLFDFVTQHLSIAPMEQTVIALAGDDPEGPIISRAALENGDGAAIRTLQLEGGAIGSYLASRAVSTLASGGVYLVGSISANEKEMEFFVDESPFLSRFEEAGPITKLVSQVPIYRVIHPEFGLLGAAEIARHL